MPREFDGDEIGDELDEDNLLASPLKTTAKQGTSPAILRRQRNAVQVAPKVVKPPGSGRKAFRDKTRDDLRKDLLQDSQALVALAQIARGEKFFRAPAVLPARIAGVDPRSSSACARSSWCLPSVCRICHRKSSQARKASRSDPCPSPARHSFARVAATRGCADRPGDRLARPHRSSSHRSPAADGLAGRALSHAGR